LATLRGGGGEGGIHTFFLMVKIAKKSWRFNLISGPKWPEQVSFGSFKKYLSNSRELIILLSKKNCGKKVNFFREFFPSFI
jgi:hypothetical protein